MRVYIFRNSRSDKVPCFREENIGSVLEEEFLLACRGRETRRKRRA